MITIIRRCCRAQKGHASLCSLTAAAESDGMELELTEAKVHTPATYIRRNLTRMYTRLPSAAAGTASRRHLGQLLGEATYVAARCCFVAAAVLLLSWLLFLGSPLHWRMATGNVRLPAAASVLYESKVFGSSMLWRDLVFLWLVPAVMALSAVVVLVLQPLVRQALGGYHTPASNWAARSLPPRALWQWLCGGVTVGDLLVVCFWAAINISWFSAALAYYQHKAVLKAAANGLGSATGQQLVKAAARSFGATLAPNLVLLFYPVSRGSVVLQVLGLSYPAGIRYHRWLGFGVLTLVALHGLSYHMVWLYSGQWTAKALEQGSGHNNLLGSVAFVFGLALWLTSLEAVRRANYAVFKTVHHVGFWGFLVFGVCHKWDLIWAFMPGLVLYGADAAYRVYQALLRPVFGANDGGGGSCGTGPHVLHASVAPGGGLCTLVLASPEFAAGVSGLVWLSVPALSWQYHPFEYVAVPWPHDGAGSCSTGLLLHIKAYNRWTKQLMSLVAKGEKITMNMLGPYCELPRMPMELRQAAQSHTADGILIIAGGNGISSAASVFMELAAAAAVTPGLPCLLVWASRSAAELETMGPLVLAMAHALQLQLTTKLFFTGTPPPAGHPHHQPSLHLPDIHHAITLAPEGASEHTSLLGTDAVRSTVAAAAFSQHAHIEGGASSAGELAVSSLCPVVALGGWWGQAGHKLAMHVVVVAGALCALALGHYTQDMKTALLGSRWPTAKAGATFTALLAVFVLIPGLLTIWVSLLLLKLRGTAKGRTSSHFQHSHGIQGKTVAEAAAAAAAAAEACSSGSSRHATLSTVSAAAVDALRPGSMGRLLTGAAGRLQLQLPAFTKQEVMQAGSTDSSSVQEAPGLEAAQQLASEAGRAPTSGHLLHVEWGRPPLDQLLKAWLATQQQQLLTHHGGQQHSKSSSSSRKQCFTVYGMGPERLVHEVQQLCDAVGGLHFVRKTHQL